MPEPPDSRTWRIRPIEARDDARVREIVLATLEEFGCVGPGYASSDPELAHMHAAYPGDDAVYLVCELEDPATGHWQVHGGGGIAPLAGSDPHGRWAELRKMYFTRQLRGLGAGRCMLGRLLREARIQGFQSVYLETTAQMTTAQNLYRSMGFELLSAPQGDTGHGSCDRYYRLILAPAAKGEK